jgi:hypothetical protein
MSHATARSLTGPDNPVQRLPNVPRCRQLQAFLMDHASRDGVSARVPVPIALMTREELEKVRTWAMEKIAAGDEPPCIMSEYTKLRSTMDSILARMDALAVQQPTQGSRIFGGCRHWSAEPT